MKKIPDIINRLWNLCGQMEVGALLTRKSGIRPNKKGSLLRLTWLKFLRAGGRFFFSLKIFYTQVRYANLNFSRAGNSNSGSLGTCRLCRHVAITSIRRTSLPESPRPRVCVGRLTTSQCVTSSSPLFRASSARAPLDRVPQ